MVRIVGSCSLCGSDLPAGGRECPNPRCRGLADGELAILRARDDYAAGRIEIEVLEARIEEALANPMRVSRGPALVWG